MDMKFDDRGDVVLTTNFYDILDNLSGEDKLSWIESFSCDDTVIKNVMDQYIRRMDRERIPRG